MAPGEPKAKVSSAAPSNFRAICLFRKRPKVDALLPPPPPPPKLEGYRVSVCHKCHQPRMVPIKPAPSAAQIAAKLAKKLRVAEEACRAQESIVAAKAFMHRHSVDDTAARRATPPRPHTRADSLACVQVVVYIYIVVSYMRSYLCKVIFVVFNWRQHQC